jgi:D-cysteine desulfhydrase
MIETPESLDYCQMMTPIIPLGTINNSRLWLKRDDLTGIELSGNKIRKLDFILKDALMTGAEGIITCGGIQSNHCRTAAFLAAKLSLEAILYLRGEPTEKSTGNHFLCQLSGAKIKYLSREEYRNIDDIMADESQAAQKAGRNMYVIPEGGSNEIGAWGYYQCFTEIAKQTEQQGLSLDAICVATGSGGTHAGLLLGKIISRSKIDIISVNVCDDAAFFQKKILSIIRRFIRKYQLNISLSQEDILVFDGFVGEGYAQISQAEIELIRRFTRDYGIILDPVYTAKAYLGLEKLILNSQLPYQNILFIHTGGIFGIFPVADCF